MREIRFRCWDQKDKKYLLPEKQGFVILPTLPSFGVTLPYENCSNPGNIDEDCIDWADADLIMGRYELEQYTGLKDKNGTEIYEGDIMEFGIAGAGKRGVVGYEEDFGSYETYTSKGYIIASLFTSRGKVIGNVHENPELMRTNK